MSSKSKRKLTKRKNAAIDRPFDPIILAKAAQIVGRYRIIIEADSQVGYLGRTVEMPMVMADASTPQACFEAVRDATIAAAATMLEMGQVPPGAASEWKRTAQINVRVTEAERQKLEDAARRHGFRGVSDFLRTIALSKSA